MRPSPFARARTFLNYHPVAKWSALVSAVGTGLLFVGLLIVLALFADLMVNRGEIPCLANLSPRERDAFDGRQQQGMSPAVPAYAKFLGMEDSAAGQAVRAAADDAKLSNRDRDLRDRDLRRKFLWIVDVCAFLEAEVGPEAAAAVKEQVRVQIEKVGVDVAIHQNVTDFGILSLAVRSRSSAQSWLVVPLARWNAWMWAEGNEHYLQGLFLVAFVIALARAGLMLLSNLTAARATIEATTRLRRAVYHHTYRLGTLAFRALGPSEAVGVSTRHLEAVHDGLYAWLTVVFREPVKFGLVLLFALVVNFWLALAIMLFALLVWLVGGQMAAYFRRRGRAAMHRAADQLALIQESLMLMRLVKIYLMEHFNQSRVERQLARYARAQMIRYFGEALYRPLLVFFGVFAALVLFLVTGMVVLDGQVGVASSMALVTALVSLYWPLVTWLDHRRYLRRARQSAAAVYEFLDRKSAVGQVMDAEFLPAMSRQLEFDKVTLIEPGTGRKLLQGVDLTITAGQRVAIVGPDDMQKHALVYLIPRFLDPNSGEIRIDRKSLRWLTLDSLRAQIAMILQHNLVFNDTVANNIGCGEPNCTLPKIIEAAKMAHAHHFVQKLPQGYETPIGEMGHPLDPGEKFRLALARAILRDPAILVIEEPLTPLDEDTKGLVDDTLARVLPGRTAIFLAHRLSTIRGCDRVYLLYRGKIEAAGEHRELLASNELYRHLQYLEFNEFGNVTGPPHRIPSHV